MLLRVAGHAIGEGTHGALNGRSVVEVACVEAVYLLLQLRSVAITARRGGKVRVVLRLVASQHQQVGNAKELQVNEDIFRLLARKTAAKDMGHDGNAVARLDGSSHSHRARTFAYRHTLEEPRSRFAVDALASVGGDIDILRIKLAQHINVGKQPLDAHPLQRRQHLERETRLLSACTINSLLGLHTHFSKLAAKIVQGERNTKFI